MKRISATEFITKIGAYMDMAQREPLTVVSHGRDKVIVLSPAEYRRISNPIPPQTGRTVDQKKGNALVMVLSIVNTSTPKKIDAKTLKRILKKPSLQMKPPARLLIEEVPNRVLAGLVNEGVATWSDLYRLAQWAGIKDDEKTTFLRDMAGNSVVGSSEAGRSSAR